MYSFHYSRESGYFEARRELYFKHKITRCERVLTSSSVSQSAVANALDASICPEFCCCTAEFRHSNTGRYGRCVGDVTGTVNLLNSLVLLRCALFAGRVAQNRLSPSLFVFIRSVFVSHAILHTLFFSFNSSLVSYYHLLLHLNTLPKWKTKTDSKNTVLT